jgi:hypothetical protein
VIVAGGASRPARSQGKRIPHLYNRNFPTQIPRISQKPGSLNLRRNRMKPNCWIHNLRRKREVAKTSPTSCVAIAIAVGDAAVAAGIVSLPNSRPPHYPGRVVLQGKLPKQKRRQRVRNT